MSAKWLRSLGYLLLSEAQCFVPAGAVQAADSDCRKRQILDLVVGTFQHSHCRACPVSGPHVRGRVQCSGHSERAKGCPHTPATIRTGSCKPNRSGTPNCLWRGASWALEYKFHYYFNVFFLLFLIFQFLLLLHISSSLVFFFSPFYYAVFSSPSHTFLPYLIHLLVKFLLFLCHIPHFSSNISSSSFFLFFLHFLLYCAFFSFSSLFYFSSTFSSSTSYFLLFILLFFCSSPFLPPLRPLAPVYFLLRIIFSSFDFVSSSLQCNLVRVSRPWISTQNGIRTPGY